MKKYRIGPKVIKSLEIIWLLQELSLSLQRQDESLDYPGKFPERASRIRHYPILKQAASFGCGFAIFEKISKKHSLVEIDGHGEGENVAYEKEQALSKVRK